MRSGVLANGHPIERTALGGQANAKAQDAALLFIYRVIGWSAEA